MKTRSLISLLLFLCVGTLAAASVLWFVASDTETEVVEKNTAGGEGEDPDLPPGRKIDKGEYLRLRNEQLFLMRGLDSANQDSRTNAIRSMERAEREMAASVSPDGASVQRAWRPLGPAPLPVNANTSYSGRVSAIAVDPTDANIVYVGTAQGGLYRSINGGSTWTPLMDNALSLAIGAIAIAPSDRTTVFVGTGEPEFSSDSFFGVGIYRISNATTTPIVIGPFNQTAGGVDIFSGRAVSEIIIHPTDPNILFASTTSGVAGIGGSTTGFALPAAGLYRTTNAMSPSPVFEKLTLQGVGATNRSVIDLATEPGNPNRLLAAVVGNSPAGGTPGDGGVYVTTDALATTPTFTRTLTTGDGTSLGRLEFAVHKDGTSGVVTVYAASGTGAGTLFKSVDGGASFTPAVDNNFCSPQCFYDIAVAVDQNDVNRVFLGGSPQLVFGRSTNGGMSFVNSSSGVHVDTQAIAIAPSDPNVIYVGTDGGIWRSSNGGTNWTTLNNSTFSATQFQGIALHRRLRNYTLGGTQDNGTEFLAPDRTTWVRSDGGDGGFAVIDQNAVTQNDVVAYHTYYNQSGSQIGFRRATSTVANGDPIWSGFYGCGGTPNGINCADATLFYAPMVGGPNATGSQGNTLYFGTTRLYRSIDQGITMTDVSGLLPGTDQRISAIAISPQNDDIRLVGTRSGSVFLSTNPGATTMNNVTGPIPARYVGRVAIDPTNSNISYVALNGFGLAPGQHIWKATDLLSGTPTWSPSGNGIPDVPVNTLAIDPVNPQTIFAGTDIGVFRTDDGGANWFPFSNGLPRVAVFGMEFQAGHRVLRISTHGKGVWEFDIGNKRTAADFDGDAISDVSIFRSAAGEWWWLQSTDSSVRAAPFGSSSDSIVPADFTGDGKTDLAFFRPSSGSWFILRSEDSSFFSFPFGLNGDMPMPGDYDGDGKSDAAVYRPSNSLWVILRSSDGQAHFTVFGTTGDLPVAADYDGDGRDDIAVWRRSGGSGAGEWWLQRSTMGLAAFAFGVASDNAVPGDYTGDGKADIAVWRPSNGNWYILRSEDFSYYGFPWGQAGDLPAPGDYDGDGKTDAAIFRSGTWFINRSPSRFNIGFGLSTDLPVTSAFVR